MLKNIKLLDLSRIIVGPYASMILSDFGIQVIKIQSPDGDPTRQWGPPWHKNTSTYYLSVNRNKRSLALNLKNSKHRQVIYKLSQKSDIVIQNFVPGTAQNLKIDYQTIKKYNQNIIYCSISGYGDIGSMKNTPAFDNIIQAQSGFMHLTGDPTNQGYKMGFAITDVLTGLYASNAILAGLMYRQQTGKGIHLKTSLIQCAMASMINQSSNYLNGNHHPNIIPYGSYKTKDSSIVICVGTGQHYKGMLDGLQLQDHQKYRSNQLRLKYRKQFDQFLNAKLCTMNTQEIIGILKKKGVPCGKVNNLQQAFNCNLAKQLNIVNEVDGVKYVRNPIRYDLQGEKETDKGRDGQKATDGKKGRQGDKNKVKNIPPPKINQHANQILTQIGYSSKQIEQLLKIK